MTKDLYDNFYAPLEESERTQPKEETYDEYLGVKIFSAVTFTLPGVAFWGYIFLSLMS